LITITTFGKAFRIAYLPVSSVLPRRRKMLFQVAGKEGVKVEGKSGS